VIEDARYLVQGSVPLIAIGSMLCDYLIGKTVTEANKLSSQDIMAWSDLPDIKRHCALLVEDLLKSCLASA